MAAAGNLKHGQRLLELCLDAGKTAVAGGEEGQFAKSFPSPPAPPVSRYTAPARGETAPRTGVSRRVRI